MKTCTIGWSKAVTIKEIPDGPRHDFILHPQSGDTKVSLEMIVAHIKDIKADVVMVDGDVFYELAERIHALEMRSK